MGCICSSSLPKNQRTNNGTDYDTDNFIETDYPIFFPNFYSKRYKNILKIYTEFTTENNQQVFKVHKIFITLNFKENKSTVIEIEKEYSKESKKHLKKQQLYGCSMSQCFTKKMGYV